MGSTWSLVHDIILSSSWLLFLDPAKCCRNYTEAGTKRPKHPKSSTRTKNGCTWEENNSHLTRIPMLIFGWQISKGVISRSVKIFSKFSILARLLLAKKCPKLGIQFPNAGYDNQSFHMLMVIFNRIEHQWIPKYNIYSITIFYTNVSTYTSLRGYVKVRGSKPTGSQHLCASINKMRTCNIKKIP